MNQKFYDLDQIKQDKIKYAGYKVFAEHTYKKASMQTLAEEAGISKALIFHYFKNKMTLYNWLFQEAYKEINVMNEMTIEKNCDFFDLIDEIIIKRLEKMKMYQVIYSFIERVYNEAMLIDKSDIFIKIHDLNMKRRQTILTNVDASKFKTPKDIELLYDMILDLSNGYYMKMRQADFRNEEVLGPYKKYLHSLKSHYYKEAFL